MKTITDFIAYYQHGEVTVIFAFVYSLLVIAVAILAIRQLIVQKDGKFLLGVIILVLQPAVFIALGVKPHPKTQQQEVNAVLLKKWTVENAPADIPTNRRLLALYKINGEKILGFISPEDYHHKVNEEMKITVTTDIHDKILPYDFMGLDYYLNKDGYQPMQVGLRNP